MLRTKVQNFGKKCSWICKKLKYLGEKSSRIEGKTFTKSLTNLTTIHEFEKSSRIQNDIHGFEKKSQN